MRGNARMQSTYNPIEYFFFVAHQLEIILALETILLVNERPDVRSIIIGKRLDVYLDIKILPLIVLLVLDMPHPPVLLLVALDLPQIHLLVFPNDLVGLAPKTWNVLGVTSADRAALGLTYFILNHKRTLFIKIEANEAKIFGLDQSGKYMVRSSIHIFQLIIFLMLKIGQNNEAEEISD
jgi:hypothetical protein